MTLIKDPLFENSSNKQSAYQGIIPSISLTNSYTPLPTYHHTLCSKGVIMQLSCSTDFMHGKSLVFGRNKLVKIEKYSTEEFKKYRNFG